MDAGSAQAFEELRPLLFSIAYRMLGSVSEAEDQVQEAFLRWQGARREEVESPRAYLSATVTRLCIDYLKSARVQRERYIGPWLPEPLLTEKAPPASEKHELAESLSTAFLVLLESLSPVERAVFLLREVFDYEYTEIARITGKSEENCRQLLARAKQQVAARKPRFQAADEAHARLVQSFFGAVMRGDAASLEKLLADDVISWSDGGGKRNAARKPVSGRNLVMKFYLSLATQRPENFEIRFGTVNGEFAVISYLNGEPYNVTTCESSGGKITAIRNVLNPDKLGHIPLLS